MMIRRSCFSFKSSYWKRTRSSALLMNRSNIISKMCNIACFRWKTNMQMNRRCRRV